MALGNVNGTNQPGAGDTLPQRDPGAGDAALTVKAKLLDIRGNSILDKFSAARYQSEGDIRFSYSVAQSTTNFTGSLKSAGDLTFQANQLYPVTRADFTLNPVGRLCTGSSNLPAQWRKPSRNAAVGWRQADRQCHDDQPGGRRARTARADRVQCDQRRQFGERQRDLSIRRRQADTFRQRAKRKVLGVPS